MEGDNSTLHNDTVIFPRSVTLIAAACAILFSFVGVAGEKNVNMYFDYTL